MNLVTEIRLRARNVIGPVIGICVVAYFAFHAIHGDRGLIAMMQLDKKVEQARQSLAESVSRRQAFEHRVNLLRTENIDPDMLEERARLMLNYGFEDEIVIMKKPPTGPCYPLPRIS